MPSPLGAAGVTSSELVFAAPFGKVGLVLAIVLALLAATASVWALLRPSPRPFWKMRATLRLLAVATAFLLFLAPIAQKTTRTAGPGWLAVLIDVSSSMWTENRAGEPTRLAEAHKWLTEFLDGAAYAELRARCRPELFAFGKGLRPLSRNDLESLVKGPAAAADGDTKILEAVEAVADTPTAGSLCGIVVVSDGIDHGAIAAGLPSDEDKRDVGLSRRMASLGKRTPIHTLAVGGSALVDLAISEQQQDTVAFVRTPIRIPIRLEAHGLDRANLGGQDSLDVTLACDGLAPVHRSVSLSGLLDNAPKDGSTNEKLGHRKGHVVVELEIAPTKTGTTRCAASVPALEGEANLSNNRQAFLLRTLRDKLRVLQVAGRPSWDVRFLRSLLKSDPNVDLIAFYILRTPLDIENAGPDEMSLIQFPSQRLFEESLPTFDLVILHDFDPGPYGVGPYLPRLHSYVMKGGSLIMVTRQLAFTAEPETAPLAQLLPVEGSNVGIGWQDEPFHPRRSRTAAGKAPDGGHAITRLLPDAYESERLWERLPPLEGFAPAVAKPSAVVLLEHPTARSERGTPRPILAVMDVGRGRSMALLSETTWRWSSWSSLGPDAQGARNGKGNATTSSADPFVYRTFWRNAFRYLTRETAPEELELELAETLYDLGQEVPISWRLHLPPNQQSRAPKLRIHVLGADENAGAGTTSPPTGTAGSVRNGSAAPLASIYEAVGQSGALALRFLPQAPGIYVTEAEVELGRGRVKHQGLFRVRASSPEKEVLAPRPDLLAWLAQGTGGSHIDIGRRGQAGSMDAKPMARLTEAKGPEMVRQERIPLLPTPYLALALLLFMAGEWLLWSRPPHKQRKVHSQNAENDASPPDTNGLASQQS